MSLLLYATPSFLFITICPATIMLFTLRRISGQSSQSSSAKTTDFYATLLFGVFMTVAGVFGIVAEALVDSRWWTSAAFAMQALGILIAQLAVIQLLTPDYLFNLLSINTSTHMLPSWRIYTLILITILASIISIISVFVVPQPPNLPSSVPTLVSLSLPIPFLWSLARIVRVAQIGPSAETNAKQDAKCTDLERCAISGTTPHFPRVWEVALALQIIAAFSVAGEVVEGALGHRVPVVQLLSAMGLVTWGGGIMTIHFVILYEPTHGPSIAPSATPTPSHDLDRVTEQPSEDFMTLKDPFASPTQAGFPLPPSPPRTVPHRRPRRRASEPLQLKRFGSFAVLAEDVKEKQAGTAEDQHTQFLEELVRHAWFNSGRTDSDSTRNNFHQCSGPPPTPMEVEVDVFVASPTDMGKSTTPMAKQEPPSGPEQVSPSILLLHPFRPVTPPRPVRPWDSHRRWNFPEPPTSFPLSSPSLIESVRSLPLSVSTYPSAYMVPPSPGSSESGSSFVSPPPTPTPGPSRYSRQKVLTLTPTKPHASLGTVCPW